MAWQWEKPVSWNMTPLAQRTHLTLERGDDLAHLILEGAPRNELTFDVFDAFSEMVDQVLPGLEVSGLILSGRGRHFCSGSNIEELHRRVRTSGNDCSPSWCEIHTQSFQKLSELPYPVVAAISGCCLGSGLELALACSARVASRNALLALPETQHELIPGCGGTVMLTELLGFRDALRFILSGEALSADEALDVGLVDRVVPRRELLREAARLASCKELQARMGQGAS